MKEFEEKYKDTDKTPETYKSFSNYVIFDDISINFKNMTSLLMLIKAFRWIKTSVFFSCHDICELNKK